MPPDPAPDPLDEIDRLLDERARALRDLAEQTNHLLAERRSFLTSFAALCEDEISPAMEAILARLRKNGGGGFIQYQPDGGPTRAGPRLTLWMSLDGEISGSPRQDRHPYLQLDADTKTQRVNVSAGDMWEGRGSHHSGPLDVWDLTALSAEGVIMEILAILRRAAVTPTDYWLGS